MYGMRATSPAKIREANRFLMCGIAALLGDLPFEQVDASLRAMVDAQVHQGADASGTVLISTGRANVSWEVVAWRSRIFRPLGISP